MNPINTYNDNRPLVIGGGYNTAATKTILTTQGVLAPGTVLGIVTADQKLQVCGIGNGNGSETARYVLTKEVDTTGGDVTLQEVLKSGVVNGDKLDLRRRGDAGQRRRGDRPHARREPQGQRHRRSRGP